MAKNPSIIGTIIPPHMMNVVPDVGGSTKFEATPGGGFARGMVARTEGGKFSSDDMAEQTPWYVAIIPQADNY